MAAGQPDRVKVNTFDPGFLFLMLISQVGRSTPLPDFPQSLSDDFSPEEFDVYFQERDNYVYHDNDVVDNENDVDDGNDADDENSP